MDIYISGPNCASDSSGSDVKIFFPYGATLIGGPTDGGISILDLTAAMYSNPPTTWNGATLATATNQTSAFYEQGIGGFTNDPVCGGSMVCHFIVKSSQGNYYAFSTAFNGYSGTPDLNAPGDGQGVAISGNWVEFAYHKL
jgi:hypothetical protein